MNAIVGTARTCTTTYEVEYVCGCKLKVDGTYKTKEDDLSYTCSIHGSEIRVHKTVITYLPRQEVIR